MTNSHHHSRLILASASPRRQEMLSRLGLEFDVIPADIEENGHFRLGPRDLARHLATAKTEAVAKNHPDRWVLGADTVVAAAGRILGKPESPAAAREMLTLLAGATHRVCTGYCIRRMASGKSITGACLSKVTFRSLTQKEIDWYIHTQEPFGKAGAYAIQGKGACFIKSVQGSYTNVVGLPLCEVMEILLEEKAVDLPSRPFLSTD